MIGRQVVFTVEPKDVQTVLALKFKDFELGDYRNKAMRPLLGYGIFATEDLFFRMTLDSATEFLFGESVHSLNDSVPLSASSFAKVFNKSQKGLALRSRLGSLMGLHYDKDFSKAVVNTRAYVDWFVQKAIDYRMALDSGNDGLQKPHEVDQQYVFLYQLSK
ncbi:Cytochrome monooxygenase himC [Penicillium daleae]|uniref:Cytochrome monooxygenase himC n=1 Tax=Penicillium daleae TaxID=63821 RepID=A0AAD6C1P3_9EURO|nr:Cytochrome monooxygenase himC [Penicillium daleae]KAJ5444033.1 Cytochrome monooxygenase himC [Penicillium daleae]